MAAVVGKKKKNGKGRRSVPSGARTLSESKVEMIPRPVSEDPVDMACRVLAPFAVEKKGEMSPLQAHITNRRIYMRPSTWDPPEPIPLAEEFKSALAAARGLFSPGKVYKFRGVRTSTLTANGSGILAATIGMALSNMSEGSSLAALFDEVVVQGAHLHLQGYNGVKATSNTPGNDIVAFSASNTESTAPSSYTVVARLPGSRICNSSNLHQYRIIGRIPKGRPWGDSSDDAGTSKIPYGSWGTFWLYTVTGQTHTNDSVCWTFLLEVVYKLRSRA